MGADDADGALSADLLSSPGLARTVVCLKEHAIKNDASAARHILGALAPAGLALIGVRLVFLRSQLSFSAQLGLDTPSPSGQLWSSSLKGMKGRRSCKRSPAPSTQSWHVRLTWAPGVRRLVWIGHATLSGHRAGEGRAPCELLFLRPSQRHSKSVPASQPRTPGTSRMCGAHHKGCASHAADTSSCVTVELHAGCWDGSSRRGSRAPQRAGCIGHRRCYAADRSARGLAALPLSSQPRGRTYDLRHSGFAASREGAPRGHGPRRACGSNLWCERRAACPGMIGTTS